MDGWMNECQFCKRGVGWGVKSSLSYAWNRWESQFDIIAFFLLAHLRFCCGTKTIDPSER